MKKCSLFLFKILSLVGSITSVIGVTRRICYYTNWSQYRQKFGKFLPSNIHPFHCTHICFAFAKLEANKLKSFEWNDETEPWNTGLYERLNNLKKINPNLKTLLSVGGWNMGSEPFMAMVATYATRKTFIDHAITYLRMRNFDGLDIDWEYPANRGSPPEDKHRYTALIREVRIAFENDAAKTGKPRLLIAAAVSAGKDKIDSGYDIPALHPYFDFITIMTYDYHGAWENKTGHNSPLLPADQETGDDRLLNMFWSMQYWYAHGVPKRKMNLGLALYGRTFLLENANNNSLGAPITDGGREGRYTGERGFLAYYEICEMKREGATVRWMNDQKVPYLVKKNQWVGYDDTRSINIKMNWAIENQFGGIAVWALDLDDFSGICPGNEKYPLMNTILRSLGVHVPDYTPLTTPNLSQWSISTAVTPRRWLSIANTVPNQQSPSTPEMLAAEICGHDLTGYVADPHSCQYFYICNQDYIYKYRCHPQTLWDDIKKKCEWKWKVQCTNGHQSPQTLTTENNSPSSLGTEQLTVSTDSAGNMSDYCVNRDDGTYKDPRGCNGFLQCSGHLTYPHRCPSGTVFDEVNEYCNFRENVPGC